MEDPRISRMYLTMVKQWFSALHNTIWRKNLMRSGLVTGLLLACVVLGLTLAYQQHMRGNFHKLKAKIATDRQDAPVPRPGGQEAIALTRTRMLDDSKPEFLSATILPGRGMNVLQIMAYVPGKGEVSLMASPSIDAATTALTGKGDDIDGQLSLAVGGAFEAPWAGRIWGTPAETPGHIATTWRAHSITLPTPRSDMANGGLILAQPADSSGTSTLPDGGNAQAEYHGGDFGANWPSKTDVTVSVLLSSRSIEMTVVAHNVGNVAEPVGIGWYPRFAILDGNRDQMRLHIPGQMRVEVRDRAKGAPTGVLLPVAGTAYDFTGRAGAKLGTADLDDCFTALHQSMLETGPVAELTDPTNGYGIRLTALSPAIKAMRVVAPANANYVTIAPQYNYDDPFGHEWGKNDTGMVVLQPGQSTQWKVRLELFSLSGSDEQK